MGMSSASWSSSSWTRTRRLSVPEQYCLAWVLPVVAGLSLEVLAASRGWPEVERWRTLQAGVGVYGSGREDFPCRDSAASLGCWPVLAVLSFEDLAASRGWTEVERWRTLDWRSGVYGPGREELE